MGEWVGGAGGWGEGDVRALDPAGIYVYKVIKVVSEYFLACTCGGFWKLWTFDVWALTFDCWAPRLCPFHRFSFVQQNQTSNVQRSKVLKPATHTKQ